MPLVSIVMGSDSDLPVMGKAAEILDKFEISYEIRILSAHRQPGAFIEYTRGLEQNGVKVVIAGAGMAAHLPGMCAALTSVPVIGVPMYTKSLGGRDSLYSIVQMPPGIPVATVAIDGALNAGLLAAKILATGDTVLAGKLRDYTNTMSENVSAKDRRLQEEGYEAYLGTGHA